MFEQQQVKFAYPFSYETEKKNVHATVRKYHLSGKSMFVKNQDIGIFQKNENIKCYIKI